MRTPMSLGKAKLKLHGQRGPERWSPENGKETPMKSQDAITMGAKTRDGGCLYGVHFVIIHSSLPMCFGVTVLAFIQKKKKKERNSTVGRALGRV